jgi:hypothetical protein
VCQRLAAQSVVLNQQVRRLSNRNIGVVVRLTEVNRDDSLKMSLQMQVVSGCETSCETICEVGKRQVFVWLLDE